MATVVPTSHEDMETPVEREARLARGRAFLAEGLADVVAGRVMEGDEAVRWLEAEIAEAEAAAH
jgi:predicted transcriptional regulator